MGLSLGSEEIECDSVPREVIGVYTKGVIRGVEEEEKKWRWLHDGIYNSVF